MAPPIPVPSDSEFINGLEPVPRKGRKRWRNDEKTIYEWDSLHGELEVYNQRGRHLGVADPYSGKIIKPALRGRKIDV